MNYWIEKNPEDLKKVLRQVDVFVINDSEARELSKEHNLVKGAKVILKMMGNSTLIRPSPSAKVSGDKSGTFSQKEKVIRKSFLSKTLIIKRGEYGLLMFKNGEVFHLPGFPLEDVLDPTGAGDSFAGGLMGYLAKTNDQSWKNLKRACVAGSVLASFSVEKLGTQRLQEITPRDIAKRFADFKKLTHFDII